MPQFPTPNERHGEEDYKEDGGNDDCTPDFGFSREILQELEEKEEVPFGPGSGIILRSVGRSAKVGTELGVRR